MRERPHLAAVTEDEGEGDVEDEQKDEDGADTQPDVSSHEGPSVPPTGSSGPGWWISVRFQWRCFIHRSHVGTGRPLGPAMLRWWAIRTTNMMEGRSPPGPS